MGQLSLHLLQSKTNKIKNVKDRPINDALWKMLKNGTLFTGMPKCVQGERELMFTLIDNGR
jgi:hypothetical protein